MAQQKRTVQVPQVLPPESPEVGLVLTDGQALTSFFGNAVTFFRTAGEIEQRAKAAFELAKKAVEPTTIDEDAAMQNEIRAISKQRKVLVEHWSITTVFSQVHKRLTAARNRADEYLTNAAQLRQQHHNVYAEKARRAAQVEQDRVRREAEQRAREHREAEQRELERLAVEAEAMSPDLSEREDAFVSNMVVDHFGTAGNPVESARVAGYKDPQQQAVRLLASPKIQAAIKAAEDARAIRQQAKARAAAPLVPQNVPVVKAEVSKAGGYDVTTWKGEVTNAQAFINAVFEGQDGIPRDVLMIDEVKLNQYARDMKTLMNRWPGVRAVDSTKTR